MLTAVLLSAFLMGLIGSTHCIGMCGGIISTLSTDFSGTGKRQSIAIQILYNVGRITSYASISWLENIPIRKPMNA